jgi:ribosomal protein L32
MNKCIVCGEEISHTTCHNCGIYNGGHVNTYQVQPEPSGNQKEPSIIKKAANLSSSFVKHAKDGFKKTKSSLQQSRMEICRSCEFYDELGNGCKNCGCYLAIKTSWASESCPIGKWGPQIPKGATKTCSECGKKKT